MHSPGISHKCLGPYLLPSQLVEGVENDTKDDVEADRCDDDEEGDGIKGHPA